MDDAITTFFNAWGMTDANDRSMAVAGSVATDCAYLDPRTPSAVLGPAAISEYVSMFAASAPGAEAAVVDLQTQHGLTRATVAFRMPGGMEQMGQYFVETTDDGQIARMIGFVGTGT